MAVVQRDPNPGGEADSGHDDTAAGNGRWERGISNSFKFDNGMTVAIKGNMTTAFGGGAIYHLGNVLILAGIGLAGMCTALPAAPIKKGMHSGWKGHFLSCGGSVCGDIANRAGAEVFMSF